MQNRCYDILIKNNILVKVILVEVNLLPTSKAFDTIDHNILFSNSYNNRASSYERIMCDVPQGSVLGPLLFIIYVNEICFTLNC